MKKILALLTLSLFLAMPSMSQAEDIAKFTCADYNETASSDDKMTVIMWLDGFMSAEAGVTITGEDWIVALVGHLESYCPANPAATLIDAANEVPEIEFEGEDLLETTCADIMADSSNADAIGALLMWSDGYASSKAGNTILDDANLNKLANHLMPFCAGNPDKTLGDALGSYSK